MMDMNLIEETVFRLLADASTGVPPDVKQALVEAYEAADNDMAKMNLKAILENIDIAMGERRPLCQDTGLAVYFVKVGQDVHVTGGTLTDAINEGTEKGYIEGYLRASTCDCFTRANLKDVIGYNLPAVIHYDIVEGDKIEIEYAAKGGGSENVSRARVLAPAQGAEGVKAFVKEVISEAGPNPCPPIIVGVGIGGTFEKAAISSKYALFREAGKPNPDPEVAAFEQELLEELNKLGIGAMGMGGTQTVLAVHVEKNPCHIASLPVSVNVQCHSSRHNHVTL